jgi:hypothetical protein
MCFLKNILHSTICCHIVFHLTSSTSFSDVPIEQRHEAVKWALILLPDENREVLQLLVSFLNLVSSHQKVNKTTETNLAVCIAPSVFQYDDGAQDSQMPAEAMAGIDCLSYLIKHHENLFSVDQEMFLSCQFSSVERCVPVSFDKLGEDMGKDWKGYVSFYRDALLQESKNESNRGWVTDHSHRQQVCGTIQIPFLSSLHGKYLQGACQTRNNTNAFHAFVVLNVDSHEAGVKSCGI